MGSDQRFSLRWNNYQSHLVTAFESLLDEKDFIDVTLGVEGRKLPAHKMLLSACSPYFRELLKGNPCQHPIIILRDIKYDDLFSLLQFMYNGEVNVAQDQLNSFLKSAESLKIRGLTDNESENAAERPAAVVPPPRERLQDNDLQPPPVKKKRPYSETVPLPHTSPAPIISVPPPPKRPQQPSPAPAPAPRAEPVKQEIIELSDDHYENAEQYTPDQAPAPPSSAYAHDTVNQSYDDGGAHAMVPADEGGMEDMQGDGTQGDFYWYSSMSEESYLCPVCNKMYSSKAALKNHLQSHEGKTSCTFCGRTFSSMSNLNKHIKNHHTKDDDQNF
eukprot:GFUD01002330.1.p1 GENE.GFUD01002330.1~~GFUD01002330.1.p1  ORF type:complete len:331 (-),score=83.47 GFUD01002330.1:381-1373(-)